MTPDDDASWPICEDHSTQNETIRHWCNWTMNYLRNNSDAGTIQPGMRYCIPIVPALEAYAEVSIATELINGTFAELFLIKPEGGVFTSTESEIPLGYWTKGEGRASISSVVADWADGSVPDQCAAATHAFGEERDVQTILRHGDELTKKLYWWNLAYHGMCTACWNRRLSTNQATTATAQTSGIDPKEFGVGPRPPAGSAGVSVNLNVNTTSAQQNLSRQQQTLDALRNKFKS